MKRMFPDRTDEEIIDSMDSVFSKLRDIIERIKIMFPKKLIIELWRKSGGRLMSFYISR